jgi:hypothetical protein
MWIRVSGRARALHAALATHLRRTRVAFGIGRGALSVADFQTAHRDRGKISGFTRGLDFHGHFAFIGLSQVRETAIFSGIPIVEETTERVCGVWIMDLALERRAFLQFRGLGTGGSVRRCAAGSSISLAD